MKLKNLSVIFLLLAVICARGLLEAATDAYIDWDKGIIIATGSGAPQTDLNERAAKESARTAAYFDAQSKLETVIMDAGVPEGGMVRDLLAKKPSYQIEMDRFIQTAEVADEKEASDGTYSVTLKLAAKGPNGLEGLIDKLQGKQGPAASIVPTGTASGSGPQSGIRRIAILPLKDQSYSGVDVASKVRDLMVQYLQNNYHYKVVGSEEVKWALEQAGLNEAKIWDYTPDMKWKPVGDLDGILFGTVLKYDQKVKTVGAFGAGYVDVRVEVVIQYRVLDAQTGRFLDNDFITGESVDKIVTLKSADDVDKKIQFKDLDSQEGMGAKAVRSAALGLASKLKFSFPIEGVVLKASGGFAYISLTKVDGIDVDSKLTVYRLGDMLTYPDGRQAGRIRDPIGSLVVVEVQSDYSKCRIEEERGAKIATGDIVAVK